MVCLGTSIVAQRLPGVLMSFETQIVSRSVLSAVTWGSVSLYLTNVMGFPERVGLLVLIVTSSFSSLSFTLMADVAVDSDDGQNPLLQEVLSMGSGGYN